VDSFFIQNSNREYIVTDPNGEEFFVLQSVGLAIGIIPKSDGGLDFAYNAGKDGRFGCHLFLIANRAWY
jgi:hypothetical protein